MRLDIYDEVSRDSQHLYLWVCDRYSIAHAQIKVESQVIYKSKRPLKGLADTCRIMSNLFCVCNSNTGLNRGFFFSKFGETDIIWMVEELFLVLFINATLIFYIIG